MSGLIQFGPREGRTRFRALLARLGNPHERSRYVHVAGTNGKGSTTTFITSMLRAQGYRVGAYFSPYVFDLRERIQVNGVMIPQEDFARWVSIIRPHVEEIARTDLGQTTEFELKTAVAFCHFAEQQVDFAVIEVGIGGRLDSTNVIPTPLVAVIVSIGWDHMSLLGDTLAKIAGEKAGILKTGTYCVTAVPPGEALSTIETIAQERKVPLFRVTPQTAPHSDERVLVTHSYMPPEGVTTLYLRSGESLPAIQLGLRGAYQASNAATAVAAIEVLRRYQDVPVSDVAIRSGLETAYIAGRFQIAQRRPDGAMLILDGAHNPDGAETLATALRTEFGDEKRYTFVFGTRRGHDPAPLLQVLLPLASRLVATAPSFKPTPVDEVVTVVRRAGIALTIREPAATAIRETWENAQPGEVVVVTGSLYTVGETPEDLRKSF